jgi:hypothetical protein
MRKVSYTVETPQLEKFETTSLSVAESIKTEQGGKMTTHLVEVEKPTPQMSATRLEWLKSGAKPLHPYKGV